MTRRPERSVPHYPGLGLLFAVVGCTSGTPSTADDGGSNGDTSTGTGTGTAVDTGDIGTDTRNADTDATTGDDTDNGGGEMEPYLLPEDHRVARKEDPVVVFPRPNDETPPWAKHRRHHPGVDYRIPIGVAFGSWPFYFEEVDLPAGCSVGAFLSAEGDELVVGPDYGVVECKDPQAALYDMHVRVHFQDDFAPIDVEWTLEVTTEGTIVIDPVAGDDENGDGTLGNPFRTIESWWRGDHEDDTYGGYQVLYRGGTHHVAADNTSTGIPEGNWRLVSDNKPLVHYGYPGEEAVFDMSETTIAAHEVGASAGTHPTGSDMFFGNIVFEHGPAHRDNPRMFSLLNGAHGPRAYEASAGGSRSVWFENTIRDFLCTTTSSDNAGVLWAPNPGIDNWRHFLLVSRVRFEGVQMGADCNVNWNGFYIAKPYNLLEEHTVSSDSSFGWGSVATKSTGMFVCHRNLDYSDAPQMVLAPGLCGSYDPDSCGPYELSYSRIRRDSPGVNTSAVHHNHGVNPFLDGPDQHPVYQFRNNLSRAPITDVGVVRIGGGWPVYIERDLWAADEPFILDNTHVNTDDEDAFVRFDISSDPFDDDLNLIGSDRDAYLGTYGAQVAGPLSR